VAKRTKSRPKARPAKGRKRVDLRTVRAIAITRRGKARRWARANYDAAMTTDENYRHWAAADDLSPDALASDWVRRTLRRRARYEVRNNCYAAGMVLTLANDVVGVGPRLQMLGADATANAKIESEFALWSRRTLLASKLRTMRTARAQDGESFMMFTTNPRLGGPVSLDTKLVEADRIASPIAFFNSIVVVPDENGNIPENMPEPVDGIVYDDYGNPVEYHILKHHPGDTFVPDPNDVQRVPAKQVVHYFRADRAGQSRGVPEITPALPLYAQLRRYTLAVIAAAETAADYAAVLERDANADEDPEIDPVTNEEVSIDTGSFSTFEIERRMLTQLPAGFKMSQLKAEQPATTYGDFKKEIINEIARCLNMPFNVAAGNSSGYNYASGRLDHQTYYRAIDVDRSDLESVVLDRIFEAFMNEAILVTGLIPVTMRNPATWTHNWLWGRPEHVDPNKDATAQTTRLTNGTTSLARECARDGLDWEELMEQRAREFKRAQELGLPIPVPTPAGGPPEEVDDED
jgi:lambda family phage portal protein